MEEGLDLFGLVSEVEHRPLFQMTVMGDRIWFTKEERLNSQRTSNWNELN